MRKIVLSSANLDSPSIYRLSTLTDLNKYEAFGLAMALWGWAANHAPNGDLTAFSETEIAKAAGWQSLTWEDISHPVIGADPAEYFDMFLRAGLIERVDGRVTIRDWESLCPAARESRHKREHRAQREHTPLAIPPGPDRPTPPPHRIGRGAHNRVKTHCKHGHPFDADNTIYTADGRACRACQHASNKRWMERKKAKEGGANG